MNVLELFAKLGLDTSEYEKGLDKSKGALSSFGGAVANGFGTVAKVGAAAMTAATGAVVAFGTESVKTGAQFDKSMSQVAATMGKSMEEMQNEVGTATVTINGQIQEFSGNLREFAQFMGSNTAFSASQAADALNYMALAGYDAQKSMDMLPNVLNLAAAGGIELARASDMVTDAQSALGLNMEETTGLVDKMAMASSKSNTSVEQLGDAILTIGGTAKNLSGGTTELAQALGLLADNGIKGAEGGTALRNILLNLTPKSEEAAKAMEQIGLNAYDANGNLRPLQDIFKDLNAGLADMTQEEKTNVLSSIFNKVDLKSVNALLNTNVERWTELSGAIDGASGAAANMAETQLDNLEGDITLFKSALEGAQIAISDGLTPTLREFVSFGSEGITSISEAVKEKGIKGAFGELGNVIGELTVKIAEKLPEVVDTAMELLGAFAKGLIDNAPIILDSLVTIGNMIKDKLLTLGGKLAEWVKAIDWNGVASQVAEYMKQAVSVGSQFASIGLDIIKSLGEGIAEAAPELLPAAIDTIADFVNFLAEQAPQLISTAADLIIGFAKGLTEPSSLGNLVTSAINLIMALADGLIDALPKLIEAAPTIIENLVKALEENAPKLAVAALELIIKLYFGLLEALPELIKAIPEIIGALVSGLIDGSGAMIDAGDSIMNTLEETLMSFNPFEWGADLISSFIDGIVSMVDNVADAASGIAEKIAEYLHFSEPDKGALSNFHTYAPDMMRLFAEGIKDNTKLVTDQIEESFDFEDIITNQKYKGKGVNVAGNAYGGMVQNLVINAPTELDPSEIARQTKNANREFVLQMRMA